MSGAYGIVVSSILIGAAGGLVATGVSLLVGRRFGKEKVSNKLVMITFAIAASFAAASLSIGFDIHHIVPNLDYLTLAEAEDRLSEQRLEPLVLSVDRPTIQLGRIVPNSQKLSPGQLVRSGTPVSFAVSDEGTNSIDSPTTNGQVDCAKTPDGSCIVTVEGQASSLVSDHQLELLLWVKPAGLSWYLQSPISLQSAGGTWTGTAQVGNSQYHPSDGNAINLALTVVLRTTEKGSNDSQAPGPFQTPEGWPVSTVERVTISLVGGP